MMEENNLPVTSNELTDQTAPNTSPALLNKSLSDLMKLALGKNDKQNSDILFNEAEWSREESSISQKLLFQEKIFKLQPTRVST